MKPNRCPLERQLAAHGVADVAQDVYTFISIRSIPLVPKHFLLSPGLLFPFQSDLVSLCPVIHERFFEPRMLQRILRCDALLWVVDKYPPQEIEELLVEISVSWYSFLQMVR